MKHYFDPDYLARTYRDPVALLILAVDLFPIYAVLSFGWGAAPLVFLYWLENLIVGAVALARMLATSMKEHPLGVLGMLFLGPFFVFHYGMFCFVHGIFLNVFAEMGQGGSPDFESPLGLISVALNSGQHMSLFIAVIVGLQAFLFVRDFLMRGQYSDTSVEAEMSAPYGRIIVLHIALFAGMGGLMVLGEPLFGVLALIGLRAIWGVIMTVRRRMTLDGAVQEKVDAPSPI